MIGLGLPSLCGRVARFGGDLISYRSGVVGVGFHSGVRLGANPYPQRKKRGMDREKEANNSSPETFKKTRIAIKTT